MTDTNVIATIAGTALFNLIVLAGLPLLGYIIFHKWRKKRQLGEVLRRAGLQIGDARYIGYCLIMALVAVTALLLWPPALEMYSREGSAFRPFVGLSLGGPAIVAALLYGLITTGFTEEVLFRGLITGSLSRRLPLIYANLIQMLIFFIPHAFLLKVASEFWVTLPLICAGALFVGWVRIKSGSIVGPWLLHATINITICLSVAYRS